MAMLATEAYNKYPNEKVVGFFRGMKPELVIRDPEIAKRILVSDFQHFYARGFNPHKTVIEPLLKNLFFADGDLWRLIRQRFTPAFSTAKLKGMFPIITERAEKLQIITEEVSHLDSYDVRELMARYTTDFIGACGFGISMDSLSNENSEFRRLGKRIFQRTPKDALHAALKLLFPELCKNLHFLDPQLEKSMTLLVQTVMRDRNYKPSEMHTPKVVTLEMTDMIMIAQVFVFFGAGFETSSTASSYTLHQLAFNPEYQLKVQEEIDQVLKKYDNKITYEAVNEMTYLEKAFYEAMRMYPSVAYIVRMCTSPKYTIPEIGVTINEGVKVMIPIQAMHNDMKYFEEPEKFNPERFNLGRKQFKNVFLPFGEGPRACVGERLGQMQSMAGLAAVLQKFSVEPAKCSVRYPKPEPTAIVAESFVGGLPLKIRKRAS
ncbi:Cytochrome P450 6B6 [Papilio machaon]|uniref:unspecific monooxygenase n=1 Tax=Papilio machaon TaxID=76193 RepID=A0A194R3Q8_PAPMA|nr:Cytochrome P450 6B6 [Papilio machaon]